MSVSGWLRPVWWRLLQGRGSPKQLPGAGVVIAFIGPDASGKSTMVAATTTWLGTVFRVQVAHLGKPPSTWLTWIPNVAGRMVGRLAPKLRTVHQPAPAATLTHASPRRGLLYRLRAVLLAFDRRALAVRLARQAERGWIVVCDRYPTAVVGAPDSARLAAPGAEPGVSWLNAFLARLEQRLYRAIPCPNLVVRLSAPVAVALDRNRDRQKAGKEGDAFIARRHKEFFVPDFARTPIFELDTSMSQAQSAQALRQRVWEWLSGLAQPEFSGTDSHDCAPVLRLRDFTAHSASSRWWLNSSA